MTPPVDHEQHQRVVDTPAEASALALRVRAEPASIGLVRRSTGEFAATRGASDAVVHDLQLVVSELVTNVIEHTDADDVTIHLTTLDGVWSLEVGGAGELADIGAGEFPSHPGQLHGRGLAIAQSLAVSVELDRRNDVIRCTFTERSDAAGA